MSTPDDPVIHSPSSVHNGPAAVALLAGSGIKTLPGESLGTTGSGVGNIPVGVSSAAAIQSANPAMRCNGRSGISASSLPAAAAGNLLRLLKGGLSGVGMNVIDELATMNSPSRVSGVVRQSASSSSGCCSPNTETGTDEARRRQKTCRVCGDHATGYNFNVITCESCKAFFRRNALRPKEFKCPYSDDCDINSVSRRFCQKCRLRKCFAVGMKKEWILNEEQLRRRKNSRLNHMQQQQSRNVNSNNIGTANVTTTIAANNVGKSLMSMSNSTSDQVNTTTTSTSSTPRTSSACSSTSVEAGSEDFVCEIDVSV
ncbi:unnamed protein product [Thelazia callipaeda]|uniref:Nuclear receptor domain-containing protein n=1 Tax=Thelazia callipaeda TaxID=103827 RepID=A0A0N5CUD2_THECL|nr:unnamed protein product [Thelazia callipaeda]